MFHLKVESSRQTSCNESSIGRRRFHLRLVPTYGLARLFDLGGGVTFDMFKVVAERKQQSQGKTPGDPHDVNVPDRRPRKVPVQGNDQVGNVIENSHGERIFSATFEPGIGKGEPGGPRPTILQVVDFLKAKDGGYPVSRQDQYKIKCLIRMEKRTFWIPNFVIIENEKRFGTESIGILVGMIGKDMMRPMFFHP